MPATQDGELFSGEPSARLQATFANQYLQACLAQVVSQHQAVLACANNDDIKCVLTHNFYSSSAVALILVDIYIKILLEAIK